MKLLKRTLLILGGLVALLAIAGLFLPTTAHVERSIVTSASPERVYSLVDGFSRFNEWSPWSELDPDTKYAYSGPASGSRITWSMDTSFKRLARLKALAESGR